MYVRLLAHG
jgi:hypothetical protein